jgi:fermentation-respiration switch protein FrsA (DUF1100 family)
MPGIPPFARSEKVADYERECRPVVWKEHKIQSADGVKLKLLQSGIEDASKKRDIMLLLSRVRCRSSKHRRELKLSGTHPPSHLVCPCSLLSSSCSILPLHLHNLPRSPSSLFPTYRGFWTSKGRASQAGIELDAQAALQWVFANHDLATTKIVPWGQSIGAGVATTLLARLVKSSATKRSSTRSWASSSKRPSST